MAAQHCELEAAGVFGGIEDCESTACCTGTTHNNFERCNLAETSSLTASGVSVKAPAFSGTDIFFDLCLFEFQPVHSEEPLWAFLRTEEQRLDWVPSWNFTRRTAPSPRAPSVSSV